MLHHKNVINSVMGKLNHKNEKEFTNSIVYGKIPKKDLMSMNVQMSKKNQQILWFSELESYRNMPEGPEKEKEKNRLMALAKQLGIKIGGQ